MKIWASSFQRNWGNLASPARHSHRDWPHPRCPMGMPCRAQVLPGFLSVRPGRTTEPAAF